jgi:hypothetical protein
MLRFMLGSVVIRQDKRQTVHIKSYQSSANDEDIVQSYQKST